MNAITRYASHSMATEGCANQIQILTSRNKKNMTRGVLCLFSVVYVTATYERKHGIHPYQLQPQPPPSDYLRTKIMETFSAQKYIFCTSHAFDVSLSIAYNIYVFGLENMWTTRCVMLCKDIDPHRPACSRPVLAPVSSQLRSYWSACHCCLLIGRGFSRQEKLRRK